MRDDIFLASGVHLARADGRLIFLDLPRDQYGAATDEQAAALDGIAADIALLAPLIEDGLLTRDAEAGRPLATCSAVPPSDRLAAGSPSIADHAAVLLGLWKASSALRRQPLATTVARLRSRRASRGASAGLVGAFAALRPFHARPRGCLFDSLALGYALSARGMRFDWVFGVRGEPFEAHCWLVGDGRLLVDDPEAVAPFVPIMVA